MPEEYASPHYEITGPLRNQAAALAKTLEHSSANPSTSRQIGPLTIGEEGFSGGREALEAYLERIAEGANRDGVVTFKQQVAPGQDGFIRATLTDQAGFERLVGVHLASLQRAAQEPGRAEPPTWEVVPPEQMESQRSVTMPAEMVAAVMQVEYTRNDHFVSQFTVLPPPRKAEERDMPLPA